MANFININTSATSFTIPLPFQHFTGDYATATPLTPNPSASNADECHIACINNRDCEFFKFSSGTCQLFNSGSTTTVSGIKIDTRLKALGMSNTYSTKIPTTTVLSTSTEPNLDACESTCNLNASCFVYG